MSLKAGIIGLGVGEKHIHGYQQHSACEVVALCDFSEEKLTDVGQRYPNIHCTPNADDILDDPDIDIVSIASYDNFHFEQIEKAIQNEKHIFVEKPVCLYEHEAKRIRSLLDKKPHLKLSSNLILRMCPRFQWLKKTIANGELGELFYIEGDYNYGRLHKITEGWRGQQEFYSVIYGGAIHLVDLILWLSGDTVIEVTGYGNQIASKQTNFRYNDLVVCLLKFESGMIAKIATNFGCVFPHFHPISVYGTNATFMNGIENGTLFTSRNSEEGKQTITESYPGVHKGDLILSFVDSILDKGEAQVSLEDIFKTMSICFAMQEASQSDKPVRVRYL